MNIFETPVVREKVRTTRYGYVLDDYQAAYTDPITMKAGEPLILSGKEDNWHGWTWLWCTNQQGKSGWVPQDYIIQSAKDSVARCDYTAIELSVRSAEVLLVAQFESGWLWCTNQRGQSGWVPAENVQSLLLYC